MKHFNDYIIGGLTGQAKTHMDRLDDTIRAIRLKNNLALRPRAGP